MDTIAASGQAQHLIRFIPRAREMRLIAVQDSEPDEMWRWVTAAAAEVKPSFDGGLVFQRAYMLQKYFVEIRPCVKRFPFAGVWEEPRRRPWGLTDVLANELPSSSRVAAFEPQTTLPIVVNSFRKELVLVLGDGDESREGILAPGPHLQFYDQQVAVAVETVDISGVSRPDVPINAEPLDVAEPFAAPPLQKPRPPPKPDPPRMFLCEQA